MPGRTLTAPRIPLLAILALLWGSNFFWIKVSLGGLSPDQLTFVRLALGALVLLAVLIARGERLPRDPVLWLHMSLAALVACVIPYLLFAYAEQRIDSSVAGIINATTPLFAVLLADALRQEQAMSRWKVIGTLIGFLGVLVIFDPASHGSQIASWAGAECLAAAACYAVSFVYMARYLVPTGLSALSLSAGQLVASSVLVALTLPFLGRQPPHLHPTSLGAALVLGALGTGLAYVVNYRLISESGASATSLVSYLLPIVAVVLGVTFLGESLPLHVIAGAVIVLLGVATTRKPAHRTEFTPGSTAS